MSLEMRKKAHEEHERPFPKFSDWWYVTEVVYSLCYDTLICLYVVLFLICGSF